jgi:hypothetical protein
MLYLYFSRAGFKAYVGYMHVEAAHTHPVVITFTLSLLCAGFKALVGYMHVEAAHTHPVVVTFTLSLLCAGFKAYVGYMHVEAAHTHPVVITFTRLMLLALQNKRDREAASSGLQGDKKRLDGAFSRPAGVTSIEFYSKRWWERLYMWSYRSMF